ncbi:MAG: hypothetical protein NTV34_04930, partial [Proteobacteria bacterium]|nr:hypothetical protein [Pseudomonadota bacterium]
YLDYGREEWFPKDIQKVLLSPNEGHKQLETQTTMYAEQIRKIFDSRKVVDSTIPQDISEHNKSNTPENSSSLPPGITEHKTPAPETSNPAMEICLKGKTMQGVLVAKEQEEKKRKEKFEGNKQRISENGTCSYECVSKWYLKQGTTFVWKQTENRCKNYTTCRYGPEDPFGNAIACRREGSVGSSPCI